MIIQGIGALITGQGAFEGCSKSFVMNTAHSTVDVVRTAERMTLHELDASMAGVVRPYGCHFFMAITPPPSRHWAPTQTWWCSPVELHYASLPSSNAVFQHSLPTLFSNTTFPTQSSSNTVSHTEAAMWFGKHKHRKSNKPAQKSAGGPLDGPVDEAESTSPRASSGLREQIRRLRKKKDGQPRADALVVSSAATTGDLQKESTTSIREESPSNSPAIQSPAFQSPDPLALVPGSSSSQLSALRSPTLHDRAPGSAASQAPASQALTPQPQSLWDRAYDVLKANNKNLVEDYETLLAEYGKSVFNEEQAASAHGTHNHTTPPRRQLLDAVITQGLQHLEEQRTKYTIAGREFVPKDQIAKAAELVLWANSWISEAVKCSPEASIAWAGISIVLPLLTNPKTAEDDNREGFTNVTFRMRYYTALGHMLQRLGQNPGVSSALMAEAESHIVNLNQHIIEYQIMSAMRYSKKGVRRYTGDVFLPVNWKQMRAKIELLEKMVNSILIQINQFASREELESLDKTSKGALATARELVSVSEQQLRVLEEQRDIALAQLQAQKDAMQQRLSDKEQTCLHLFRLTGSTKDTTYEWYKDRVEERVPDTCRWFLQHANFQEWLKRESGPVLVSADPGCGKSVLAKSLIDHELRQIPGTTVCYFFFKDQDQCTVWQALCALLHQLISKMPFLIEHAMGPYINEGENLIRSTRSLWAILENAVKDRRTGSVTLVLDALDECAEPEFENLIQNIKGQFASQQPGFGKLKYLLTSRPYEQIVSKFHGLLDAFPHVRIPGEDQSEEIGREVNHVIKYRVEKLSKEERLSPAVKTHLEKKLLSIEHRTYLWVYLVFDHLKNGFKKTEKGIEAAIDTLPENVNQAYQQILSKSKDTTMVRRALGIVLAARQPLTLAEMNVAVNIDHGRDLDLEDEEDFKLRLRSWCGLFVSVYHGKVYFLHQTAREFLTGSLSSVATISGPRHFSITTPEAHAILAESCVLYLDKFNSNTRLVAKIDIDLSDLPPFLRYAATDWGFHFRMAVINDDMLVSMAVGLCHAGTSSYYTWNKLSRVQVPLTDILPGLMMASHLGLESVVKRMLLENGADIEAKDEGGRTPLSFASDGGHEAVVQLLLQNGADIEAKDGVGRTPLSHTSVCGHEAVVQLLLQNGADIEAKDTYGWTPLLCASRNGHEAVVQLLLRNGADIEAKDKDGWTPLLCASRNGHEAVVQLLLRNGADIEAKDKDGWTPLLFASGNGYEAVVQLLLRNGADIEAKDKGGWTPLLIASFYGRKAVVQLLLRNGADIEAKDTYGWTPLLCASRNGHEAVVQLLLRNGADIEAKDTYGWTPLLCASRNGHEAVVQLLLQNGADIEAKDTYGWTPLLCASRNGHKAVVQLLLEKGANVNTEDADGDTPLSRACENKYTAIVELLQSHGAQS
ncbi:ankyrin repeat protein [Ophiostoma piceae UAMH 11346]|uniref:Ankyrin repeat protein n=1 Tax=Ophiostoma piceae (strain UAMH 11346) TaxID=1262450 RepID=S3CSD4_OPHP1|nr:ankyrin repeat protein [Ophiostoma piceae UAMH 11346]